MGKAQKKKKVWTFFWIYFGTFLYIFWWFSNIFFNWINFSCCLAQPQRLPQLPTCSQEPSEEETIKIKNGHPSLSNGNGIHHGAKHVSADNRRLSAPVSHKMHRKIQSSLSVNSDISKKSKVNAVFSQKTGSSPEGKLEIRAYFIWPDVKSYSPITTWSSQHEWRILLIFQTSRNFGKMQPLPREMQARKEVPAADILL